MKIDLLGGSYENRFIETNPQRTVNWYPVVSSQTEQSKTKISLQPTTGLTLYITLPGRYLRGLFTVRTHLYTKCFAVVDQTLYEITDHNSYNTIGILSNIPIGSTKIFMECDLHNELFIGSYAASYVYNLSTQVLTQVTDIAFPNNVTSVSYLDQYMIVSANGAVFESLTTSALNWNVGQTYSPTFKSAPVIAVGVTREQIFNFTTETIEVFINDGTSPYSRLPRTSMLLGIKAKDSLATFSEGFVFLGGTRNGETRIFFYDGWNNPLPISDESIAWQINQARTLEDAYGYIQDTKDGQAVYYLTVPSLNKTFTFSFGAKVWTTRQSTIPYTGSDGTSHQGIFRGIAHTSFNGKHLFGDQYSAKIFIEDYNNQTEDGNYIYRERISQEIQEDDKNVSHDMLVIDGTSGQSTSGEAYLQVSWSDDGGRTFGQAKFVSLGEQGEYLHRIRLNKLGTSRRRVYKLVLTDPVPLMIQTAYLNATVGLN